MTYYDGFYHQIGALKNFNKIQARAYFVEKSRAFRPYS
jgi:hypothetical protein